MSPAGTSFSMFESWRLVMSVMSSLSVRPLKSGSAVRLPSSILLVSSSRSLSSRLTISEAPAVIVASRSSARPVTLSVTASLVPSRMGADVHVSDQCPGRDWVAYLQ